MFYLGYDIGSSSVKASLVEASGKTKLSLSYPATEMEIISSQSGWAEQHPELWWENVCQVTRKILAESKISPQEIQCIGIAYQMHGLVLVDKHQRVLRPSIIWCDSRAVEIGRKAFDEIGKERCLSQLLNSPGNFTASKLKWVKDNEPEVYARIDKILLPGDFIAMKLTGKTSTTISGLSEAILWDFSTNSLADVVLNHYGIDRTFIPEVVETFGNQGTLKIEAAEVCGLSPGVPVTYRAGDQPNNALSLGVLKPGEIAATGGTSGVVYGVVDEMVSDNNLRLNSFIHVNHKTDRPRIGVLLCINGAGILYNWINKEIAGDANYKDMEDMMASIPIGSEGLRILPFGNGAERILQDENIGAQINNLQFTRHHQGHIYRAALEGIAYAFKYGMEIMKEKGMRTEVIRVGNDNLFQSNVFSSTVSAIAGCRIEVINTTGATGAAKGAAYGLGEFTSLESAFSTNEVVAVYEPHDHEAYEKGYQKWKLDLEKLMGYNK